MQPTTVIASARIFPKPLVVCIALVLSSVIDAVQALPEGLDRSAAQPTSTPSPLWQIQSSKLHEERLRMRQLRVAPSPHVPVVVAATGCADDGSADTLRALVAAASSGDSIDLSALVCSTITLTQGAIPVMVDDLTIIGPGATHLTIDGNHLGRVFAHYGYGTLSLNDMTISNGSKIVSGYHIAAGACVASAAYLSFTDTVVSHCNAEGEGAYGGAVFGYGLSMRNSTISNSIALGTHPSTGTAAFGGGAFVYTLSLVNSTVSGNSAQRHVNPGFEGYEIGGAIVSIHGGSVEGSTIDSNYSYGLGGGIASFDSMTVSNSTISGNRAQNSVGGGLHLRVFADLTLYNDTITNNVAQLGGGVFLNPGPHGLTTISSIISGNSTGVSAGADIYDSYATTVGGTNNLIGSVTPAITLPADTLRTSARLQPLAANGGSTRTHALSAGSPAIDAGSNAQGLANDQRGSGFARVFGAAADIGAFEAQQVLVAAPAVAVPASSIWTLLSLAGLLGFSRWLRSKTRPN